MRNEPFTKNEQTIIIVKKETLKIKTERAGRERERHGRHEDRLRN